jgi:hypothetical protein
VKEGRVYVGERTRQGCRVVAVDPEAGVYELPRPGRHSRDFEWGYGGSGPADLAWALLADAVSERAADELYQAFKWDVVVRLPRPGFALPAEDVRAWERRLARARGS